MSSPRQMPISTSGTPTPATPLTSSSDLHLGSVGLSPAPSSSPLSTINSALQNKARGDARMQVGAQYGNNSLDMNLLGNSNAMIGSMNGPSSGSQSIALNTMARGSGAPFPRANMNLTNSGTNQYHNSLPQLQQDQLANNFVNHLGINGSPEQSRVSLGQVSCFIFSFYCTMVVASALIFHGCQTVDVHFLSSLTISVLNQCTFYLWYQVMFVKMKNMLN